MKCEDCKYQSEVEIYLGCDSVCRRHAPTDNGWPLVAHDDWCGDFESRDGEV